MRKPFVQKSLYTVPLKSCWTCKHWSGLYFWVQFKKIQTDTSVVPHEFQTDLGFVKGSNSTTGTRIWWLICLFILNEQNSRKETLEPHFCAGPWHQYELYDETTNDRGTQMKRQRSLKTGHGSQAPGKSKPVQHSVLVGGYLSPEYQPFKIQSQSMVWKLWNRISMVAGGGGTGNDKTKAFVNRWDG